MNYPPVEVALSAQVISEEEPLPTPGLPFDATTIAIVGVGLVALLVITSR